MDRELIDQAKRGDLTGMQFGVLARMSNESKRRRHKKDREERPEDAPDYQTGLDIDTRERQVIRCTKWIEARGGTVIDVYDEPHTSAWKRRRVKDRDGTIRYRVIRPVYQQALKDLARGESKNGHRLDGLMCVDADRLTRDNRDLEDAIDVVMHSDRPILEMSGTLDLLTDNGRTNARVIVSFKNGQSADTARRVRDMHEALQEAGIPSGGHRPFGWLEDRRALHPIESEILSRAISDVIGGRSINSITAEWNRLGITTARGNRWINGNLRTLLRNPRLCGYRMRTKAGAGEPLSKYRGDASIKYGADGKPVIGQWQAIVTPEVWRTLQAVLGDPQYVGTTARVYLATGVLRCGKDGCDSALRATKTPARRKKPEGHWVYTCPSLGAGGCGGVSIDGPETDKALAELVLAKWELEAADRNLTRVPDEWDGQVKLERLYENMVALKAARNAEPPKISAERYYADLAEYEAQERALIKERNRQIRRAQSAANVPANLRADWTSGKLTPDDKRAYIRAAYSAVVVTPAGGKRYVPVETRLIPVPTTEDED